jgi:hypothetical protein
MTLVRLQTSHTELTQEFAAVPSTGDLILFRPSTPLDVSSGLYEVTQVIWEQTASGDYAPRVRLRLHSPGAIPPSRRLGA